MNILMYFFLLEMIFEESVFCSFILVVNEFISWARELMEIANLETDSFSKACS